MARVTGEPVYQNGRAVKMQGAFQDITEQAAAEEELQESAEKLRGIFETIHSGIILVDASGVITFANRRMAEMFGGNLGQVVGRTYLSFTHDSQSDEAREKMVRLIKGEIDHVSLERLYRKIDGSSFWGHLSGSRLHRSDGSFWALVGIIHDVTDRKLYLEALLDSEERFRLAFENANDGLCLVGADSKIFKANRRLSEILGYARAELENMFVNDITHPDDVGITSRFIKDSLADVVENSVFEKRYIHKSGQVIWGQVSSSIVKDANHIPKYFISHVQDITQRKKDEDEIRSALEEKEVLLRELHHRVKNNMQVVISLMNLQAEKYDDARLKNAFLESKSRVYAMAAVHETLHQSSNLTTISLEQYLSKLCLSIRQSYRQQANRIEVRVNVEPVEVMLEQAYPIGLVVNELLSNALKYAFAEDGQGTVEIAGRRTAANSVALRVADNGQGLPAAVDRRHPESLGLKIVWALVEEQLGGTIVADAGPGARFDITFPL